MSKKILKLYKFKSEELNELIKNEMSCIKLIRTVEQVNIHPCDLKGVSEAVDKTLDTKVGKYDKRLGGLLLSYNKLKLLPGTGAMRSEAPIVYLLVEGDFYVFSPQVGSVLLADVNKVSEDHVGCIVHKIFNVSIPRSNKDEDGEQWIGKKLKLGQKIYVKITFMDLFYTIPYIKGEIDQRTERLIEQDEVTVTTEEKKGKSKKKQQTSTASTSSDVEVDKVKPVKKKNKSKKKSNVDNVEESIDDVDEIKRSLLSNALAESSLDGTLDKSIENGKSEKKSKKRKKETLNIDIDRIKQTLLANAVAVTESSLDETDKENSKKKKNSKTKSPKKKSKEGGQINVQELMTPVQSKKIDELPNVSTFGTPDFTSTVRSKKSKKSKQLVTPDVDESDVSTLGTPDFTSTIKSKKSKKKSPTLDDSSPELLKSPKSKSKKLRLDSEQDIIDISAVTEEVKQEKISRKQRKRKEDKDGESPKKPKTQSLKDFQLELLQKYLKPDLNI